MIWKREHKNFQANKLIIVKSALKIRLQYP